MARVIACFAPLRGVSVVLSAAVTACVVLGAVFALGSCTTGATPMCGADAGCGPNLDGAMLDGLFDSAPPSDVLVDAPADVGDVSVDVVDAPTDVPVDVVPDALRDGAKD